MSNDDYVGGRRVLHVLDDVLKMKLHAKMVEEMLQELKLRNNSNRKACINVWDDECVNEALPGTGEDDDNFGSGSPGKRSGVGQLLHPCPRGSEHVGCLLRYGGRL